jgi:hypothetical protein
MRDTCEDVGKGHLGDTGLNFRVILKWILKIKWDGGLGSSDSEQGSVTGSWEHHIEPSRFIKQGISGVAEGALDYGGLYSTELGPYRVAAVTIQILHQTHSKRLLATSRSLILGKMMQFVTEGCPSWMGLLLPHPHPGFTCVEGAIWVMLAEESSLFGPRIAKQRYTVASGQFQTNRDKLRDWQKLGHFTAREIHPLAASVTDCSRC